MRPSSSSAARNNPSSFGGVNHYGNSSDEDAMAAAERARLTRPTAAAVQHNHPPYATGTHKNRWETQLTTILELQFVPKTRALL